MEAILQEVSQETMKDAWEEACEEVFQEMKEDMASLLPTFEHGMMAEASLLPTSEHGMMAESEAEVSLVPTSAEVAAFDDLMAELEADLTAALVPAPVPAPMSIRPAHQIVFEAARDFLYMQRNFTCSRGGLQRVLSETPEIIDMCKKYFPHKRTVKARCHQLRNMMQIKRQHPNKHEIFYTPNGLCSTIGNYRVVIRMFRQPTDITFMCALLFNFNFYEEV